MGSVVPVAFQALQAFQTISNVAQVVDRGAQVFRKDSQKSDELALAQLQQHQQQEARFAIEKNLRERQEVDAAAKKAELSRRQSLKRAVARQRAQFGSSGISAGEGSSEAVLLGLFSDTEEEKAASNRIDNLKRQALDQNLDKINRVNTLQYTQAAQRNRLKNKSSSVDDLSALLQIF